MTPTSNFESYDNPNGIEDLDLESSMDLDVADP